MVTSFTSLGKPALIHQVSGSLLQLLCTQTSQEAHFSGPGHLIFAEAT